MLEVDKKLASEGALRLPSGRDAFWAGGSLRAS